MFLPELNFYVPLIRGLEQGKGAVMEVLTPLQHRAALLMVPTELGAHLAAPTGLSLTEGLFENNLLLQK